VQGKTRESHKIIGVDVQVILQLLIAMHRHEYRDVLQVFYAVQGNQKGCGGGKQGGYRHSLESFLKKSQHERNWKYTQCYYQKTKTFRIKLLYYKYSGSFIKISMKCVKRKFVTEFSGCLPSGNLSSLL
jgi:hypothetical protein